jgi:outer membrane protein assembly factor BamB
MRVLLSTLLVAWPQFRGPDGRGVAGDGANPPAEFGPSKLVLWKTAVPSGHSSPVLWDNRVYLSAFNRESKTLEVLGIDARSGKIAWRRPIPAQEIEATHEISGPATATPAVDEKRVYAYFGSYGLIAFDHDGNQQWAVPLPLVKVPYGSGTSPILAGDLLILSRDERAQPYLLAVDKATGKTVWKQRQYAGQSTRPFNASTPCVWKDEIVLHHRNEVVAFDLATGARKWWVSVSTQGAGSPAAGDGVVYVGTWFNDGEPDLRVPAPDFDTLLKQYDKNGDGFVSRDEFPEKFTTTRRIDLDEVRGANQSMPGAAIFTYADRNRDGKIDRAEWEQFVKSFDGPARDHGLLAIRMGGRGDVATSNVLWKEPHGVPEVPMPLVYKDRVYTVTNGGIVSCMDAASGKLVFRGRLGAAGGYFSSPIAAGGRIYFASSEGVVSVIGGGDKLDVLARNELHEPVFATPAVVGDRIYVRTTEALYAFGKDLAANERK